MHPDCERISNLQVPFGFVSWPKRWYGGRTPDHAMTAPWTGSHHRDSGNRQDSRYREARAASLKRRDRMHPFGAMSPSSSTRHGRCGVSGGTEAMACAGPPCRRSRCPGRLQAARPGSEASPPDPRGAVNSHRCRIFGGLLEADSVVPSPVRRQPPRGAAKRRTPNSIPAGGLPPPAGFFAASGHAARQRL